MAVSRLMSLKGNRQFLSLLFIFAGLVLATYTSSPWKQKIFGAFDTVHLRVDWRRVKMSEPVAVFDTVHKMACTEVMHPQASCTHSVASLFSKNLKVCGALYIPLSLAFLVKEKKELSPSILLQAIKNGLRSGIWLSTCSLKGRNDVSIIG